MFEASDEVVFDVAWIADQVLRTPMPVELFSGTPFVDNMLCEISKSHFNYKTQAEQ